MIKLTTNDSIVMGKIIDLEFSRGFIFTNEIRGMNRYLTKFSHDGNYIGLIGTIGHGPGEYARFSETAFDTTMQRIVLDANAKLMIYDYNGNFLSSSPHDANLPIENMMFVDNQLWMIVYRPMMNAEKGGYKEQKLLYRLDNRFNIVDSTLIHEIFLNRQIFSFGGISNYFSILKSGKYCYIPVTSAEPLLRDTLYKFEGNRIIPVIKLDFSEILTTQKDIYGNIDFKEYVEKYEKRIRSMMLTEIYRTNQFVFAKYWYGEKQFYFCYDLKGNKRYNMQDGFTDDLFGTKGVTELIPINLDKGEFCFVKYGYELEGIIDGINESSNPVVFFVKTKE
jgi:hypothetical protein